MQILGTASDQLKLLLVRTGMVTSVRKIEPVQGFVLYWEVAHVSNHR